MTLLSPLYLWLDQLLGGLLKKDIYLLDYFGSINTRLTIVL